MSQNNGLEISADKPWVYLDVAVGLETYVTDFRTHLEPRVRPEWSSKELGVKLFDSGITNTLVAIFLKDRGLANSRDDVVLLRMNGVGSEKIIDRTDELHCMHLLHREGIGPPVYAQLKNGLCYGFLPGRQMRLEEVREEGVAKKVAMVMSSLHGVEIPEHFQGRKPQLWAKIDHWLTEIPSCYGDHKKQKSFLSVFGSKEALVREVEYLRTLLATTTSPVVFCHNDTLIANYIMDEQNDQVYLVDYEYAGPNFLAFDIANHFCEYAGVDEVNYDRFPDKAFQKKWIRSYLCCRRKLKQGSGGCSEGEEHSMEEEVEAMFRDVTHFTLASHMFWTVWALIQTQYSIINFNYMEYAGIRYREYLRRKRLLNSS